MHSELPMEWHCAFWCVIYACEILRFTSDENTSRCCASYCQNESGIGIIGIQVRQIAPKHILECSS